MNKKDLDSISILGLGLLGGSLGMAVNSVFPHVTRYGYSHRAVTRDKASASGVIDINCSTIAQAVSQSQLVVLASPIGTFPDIMREMAPYLNDGTIVTDVGSTKVLPVRWARKLLPGRVQFLGSHPMAGSEQRGVEFARADLFTDSHCIVTPTSGTRPQTYEFLCRFWEALGMRLSRMSPAIHDKVLARISHLPHVLAMCLMNISNPQEMLLCGKGFLDTTRIASGPPSVWRDILMGNAVNTEAAIERLVKELIRVQKALREEKEKVITKKLHDAQTKRNKLVEKKLRRKELPA